MFWCDGAGRFDYSVFGDVLAFYATYEKNKYKFPLVVFFGVNHRNQSIVFASAIVGNEKEETYVWLLEVLVEAMSGKTPRSVITDGDMAMRNAIRRVLPNSHHRLCAWHLLRNAASNVSNTTFVSKLKRCMLGDYEVGEFERKWDKMVADFGLEQNMWVREMYEKRHMWATAHIRGNSVAGFRTMSQCEGLHSFLGRYVNYQNNLLEFLQHFFRALNYMRYKEVEADFLSSHGEPVLQPQLQVLEKSAADIYTRGVFLLFRPVLERSCTCRVLNYRQTTSLYIYNVSKYYRNGLEWTVTFCPSNLEFKCSCQRLESIGIPCEHVVCVLVSLDIVQIPECLVLKRWTKNAKDSILSHDNMGPRRDPSVASQYVGIMEKCKKMAGATVYCRRPHYVCSTIDWVDSQMKMLEAVGSGSEPAGVDPLPQHDELLDGSLRNPARVRTKGYGASSSSVCSKGKPTVRRTQTCGIRRAKGHNRKSCRLASQVEYMAQTQVGSNAIYDNEEDDVDECEDVPNHTRQYRLLVDEET